MANIEIGDAVRVNEGVMCPDYEKYSLAGLQGFVTELFPEAGTLDIYWDEISLRALPSDYIRELILDGMGWDEMRLGLADVCKASPRGNLKKAKTAYEIVAADHVWDHLSDNNPGIAALLDPLGTRDVEECLDAWQDHLEEKLKLPFEAEVEEFQERGSFRQGDVVQVDSFEDIDEYRGILVNIRYKGRKYIFPLCDLEATNKNSSNYQPLNDYVVWFANR